MKLVGESSMLSIGVDFVQILVLGTFISMVTQLHYVQLVGNSAHWWKKYQPVYV